MKKRSIFALFFLLLFSFGILAGCHGTDGLNEFVIPERFDENAKITVVFWAKNDTNINQTMVYEKAEKGFEELYPNVDVQLKLYTDYGRIYNDVITNIATATTPNVCITYPDHIATYITGKNIVVPLDDLIDHPLYGLGGSEIKFDAPNKSQMIPKFMEECKIGQITYALPYMRSSEALYINKTALDKMGIEIPDIVTWDFIWEVSDLATEKDENGLYKLNGQNVMIPFIYKSTDNMMISMLKQSNAGFTNDEGEILLFNDTTKNILLEISKHISNSAFSTFKISSYPGNFMNADQCIFAIDSTAGASWIGSHAIHHDISKDQIKEFETVVRPIPQFDTSDPKMISQGPSVCIFNKEDPQTVLASWLFVQYLLTNDIQISYATTEGYVPVTSKAQETERYKDYLARSGEDYDLHYSVKIDATKLVLDNIENTFITSVFNGSASVRDAAGELIERTVKAVRRKETVNEDYINSLFSNITSQYRLDQLKTGETVVKKNLGAFPPMTIWLFVVLIVIWVVLLASVIIEKIRKKNNK